MRPIIALGIAIILCGLFGCSGAGQLPVSPNPMGVLTADKGESSHQLWGLWQFQIDPAKGQIGFAPIRSGELHLNALNFLEPPVNINLTIEGTPIFAGGTVTVDIGLRHPFLGQVQYTGFDVKGILIGYGSETIAGSDSLRYAGENDLRLLNPDGFTRWWNPAQFPPNPTQPILGYKDGLLGTPDSIADFTATVNAYKYFADNLSDPAASIDALDVNSRGVFSAGTKNVRRYIIDFTPSGLIFNYAVDASWKMPIGDPPWTVPGSFGPLANQPEPYRVVIHEVENTLAYEISTGAASGNLKLWVDVYDWFDANKDIVCGYPAHDELVWMASSVPIGGGAGYSTYEIETIPNNINSADDILLWIAAECQFPIGYGGILPGEVQGMYFPYIVEVQEASGKECGEEVHTYFGEYSIVGVELDINVFHGDLGLQEVGKYAGMAVMQTSTGKFSVVDITESQIGNATHYFDWMENNYHHSIDCCPYSGRIALCDPGTVDDEIDIFDVDGNLLTTYNTGGAEVVCLDFNDNGDIWMITRSGTTPQLRHLSYVAGSPYYNDVPGDTTSIASHYPASQDWIFGDIAIDYKDKMAFIMGCISGPSSPHYLAAYDISGMPVFLYGRNDVFSGPIAATKAASTNYARRLDIEIDHSLAEYCRIVVSGQLKETSGFRHQLVRLDYKLKTMDVYTGELSSSYQGLPSQIIISPKSPHNLIATPQILGMVLLFKCDDW